MARPATSPDARLRRLKAALPKAREAGKGGKKITSVPMSKIIGVTWPTLRGWCDDLAGFAESGAFTGGGNGVEYQFKPIATTQWLIRHFEKQVAKSRAAAKRQRGLIGGNELDSLPEDMDLDQIKKAIQTSSLLRMERQRSGTLVEAAAVADALGKVFSRMQHAMVTAASRLDPSGQWPEEFREAVENAVESIGGEMVQAGEAALIELRAGNPLP